MRRRLVVDVHGRCPVDPAVERFCQLNVDSVPAVDFQGQKKMTVYRVDREVVSDTFSEGRVGKRGWREGVEAGGEHRSRECLSPVSGLENPYVNGRRL